MKVVACPGSASLGESLHLVDMLAVLLILALITLGVYVTVKMFRQTGLLLLYQAGEVGGGTGTILRQDIMASIFAGPTQPPKIPISVLYQ